MPAIKFNLDHYLIKKIKLIWTIEYLYGRSCSLLQWGALEDNFAQWKRLSQTRGGQSTPDCLHECVTDEKPLFLFILFVVFNLYECVTVHLVILPHFPKFHYSHVRCMNNCIFTVFMKNTTVSKFQRKPVFTWARSCESPRAYVGNRNVQIHQKSNTSLLSSWFMKKQTWRNQSSAIGNCLLLI